MVGVLAICRRWCRQFEAIVGGQSAWMVFPIFLIFLILTYKCEVVSSPNILRDRLYIHILNLPNSANCETLHTSKKQWST
jgi:hypothetical protein